MTEVNAKQLPPGWSETTLDAVQLDLAGSVNPARLPDETFELYSVPSYERLMPEILKGSEIGSNKRTIEPGTVLLCKINPRINRVWVTGNYSTYRKIASTEWIPFFPLPSIEPRFLAYFLRQNAIRDFLAGNASGVGGSLMRVRAATFRGYPFHLAPHPEQIRIADALDELFSDLDAGVVALEQARDKLKLYRAAVLKGAVEGALTVDWREKHPYDEHASALLQRILVERRRHWIEEQLRKFKAKGKEPPKNWRAKYKEPVAPDTTNLPKLPAGWCWATVDQVCSEIRNGYSRKPDATEGTPILRISSVRPLALDLGDVRYLSGPAAEYKEFLIKCGDILFTRYNGTRSLVAVCAVVPEISTKLVHPDKLIRCRVLSPFVSVPFIAIAANVGQSRAFLERRIRTTAGQAGVSGSDIKETPVPLAPLQEQTAIVEAVEDQLSVIDHLETELDTKLKNANALRQAILRQAFTGKLVQQDPNDEPASDLLKRIAVERQTRAHQAAAIKRTKKNNGPPVARRRHNRKNINQG